MIRVGTRSSRLARAQTWTVLEHLEASGHGAEAIPLDTLGDREKTTPVHHLGVAGAFTTGLEAHLAEGSIDLAVHSLKDLPVETTDGLTLAAIPKRGAPQDVLVFPPSEAGQGSLVVRRGARVGTSGPRRQSQLLSQRPDLAITNVRGNVDTRLRKLREGWFDALVTARVALDRMDANLDDLVVHDLDPERFPPAPGQAAIAVQAREGSPAAAIAADLDHPETRQAVEAERRLLDALGGGCGLPMGAWVRRGEESWQLDATFAGDAWDPSHEGHLIRVQEAAPGIDGLLETAAAQLAQIKPRPRRPALDGTTNPDGPPVLVVASEPTTRSWTAALRAAGHASHPVPTRTFEPTAPGPQARRAVEAADWIAVTSRQGVAPLADVLDEDATPGYVAAVGPSTARKLQAHGLPCHLVAREATGQALARDLVRVVDPDSRVLLVQGDQAHGRARGRLTQTGLALDTWQAYRTHETPIDPDEIPADLPAEAALVMSPRNAEAVRDFGPERLAEDYLALGPSTAKTLRSLGLQPASPERPTPEAVRELIR